MSTKYKIADQIKPHFVTFTVIDWIDIFIRDDYRSVLIDSIRYCQVNKGLEVYAYCFMTSHIHMIVSTGPDTNLLEGTIRDMKSFTSRKIREVMENTNQIHESRKEWILKRMYQAGKCNNNNIDFQFWQQHYHPIELNTNELIDEKLEYIHLNPVAAGFVDIPEAWLYSSARDYSGIAKGAIELVYLT
jgi:REP element-mobilizing transposase RayT